MYKEFVIYLVITFHGWGKKIAKSGTKKSVTSVTPFWRPKIINKKFDMAFFVNIYPN